MAKQSAAGIKKSFVSSAVESRYQIGRQRQRI
jgi:hypothetical protein